MEKSTKRAELTLPLRSLQRIMTMVMPAVEKRATNPALSSVRIEPRETEVVFSTSNQCLSVKVLAWAEAATAADPLFLPAHRLDGFVKLLGGGSVTLKRLGGSKVELRCSGTDAKFPNLEAAGFPFIEDAPTERVFEIRQDVLGRMLKHTAFAVSKEEKQANVRGALLEVAEGKMNLVATDGVRLARYSIAYGAAGIKVLIPEALLGAMSRTVRGESSGACSLAVTQSTIFACFDDDAGSVELAHKAVSAQFPNYRAIIPKKAEGSVRVLVGSFVAALQRCMSIAEASIPVFSLSMSPETLKLSARNPQVGETDDVLSVASSFQFPEISGLFRCDYLMEALARIRGEVTLGFVRVGVSSGLWIVHETESGETFEYVLMGLAG